MDKLNTLVLASLLQTAVFTGLGRSADAGEAKVVPNTGASALAEAIEAHGGLETWQSYARMDYATTDFPLGANAPFDFTQTTDLNNRRHLTRGEGFVSGKNEDGAWALPSVEALGLPPAFFESGNFYFIAMPFVFADPGVVTRDIEPTEFQGKTYDRVAVSYPQGVGDTPEDDYILYIDSQTRRLKMIDFVPTSAEVNGDTPLDEIPRKALVFDTWERYDGLLIPSQATFYGWTDGQLQGEGSTYRIHSVKFSKDAPGPEYFRAERGRVLEETAYAE